jgi:integrase
MSVDNRGTTDVPRWYYSFMIRGVRYFGSIPEARTKAEASKVEAMKRLEVYEGRYGKEPGVKDFCEFVDQVYMEYAKNNKATWKHDLFRSETLKQHFQALRFRDITPRSVEKFIVERLDSDSRRKSKRSPVSVHKEFSLLSSIFNMAMREEVAASNPCLKISKKVREKIPARNKRDRFMSLEEESKLFNIGLVASRARFRPIVRLGIHLGARLGELMAIKRGDVNLGPSPYSVKLRSKGQNLKVEVRPNHVLIPKSKNGKPRTIPLSNLAREIVAELLAEESESDYIFANPDTGRPYTNVGRAFTAACKSAGIQDLTFHDLRHTFASRLREAGVDAVTRRDLLGHSTVEMSDDYTHSSEESRLRAVESIADYRTQDYSNFTTNNDSESSLRIAS